MKLIEDIKINLSADLLKKEYINQNKNNPLFGHCYVATETLFYLLNDKDFKPKRARDKNNIVHWWLENIKTKEILDVTSEQYYLVGENPPYEDGKFGGFLTKLPSKRAEALINKIKNNIY
jgi:hypothetical protein